MVSAFDVLVLSRIPNIGPTRLRSLIARFGDSCEVFTASARTIALVEGFSKKLASQIVHFFRGPDLAQAQRFAERELSRLNATDGQILTYWDKGYPDALKRIYDPPPFIFLRGDYMETDRLSIAIVGTRSPSEYGVRVAERFTQELTTMGIVTVSGLARGIDTVVHTTALKHNGRTLGVIGSGLDVMYPPENKPLANRIACRGAVITEYVLGTKPDAGNFPRRNRIISGLSLGTLVVETDVGGGAMITAGAALDQNREVFAVPGNINVKKSRGCNTLIKESRAKLVETVDDILGELALQLRPILKTAGSQERRPAVELTLFEKSICDHLSSSPAHIDLIAERTGFTTADTLVSLLSLEFKGLVKQLQGKRFVKIDDYGAGA